MKLQEIYQEQLSVPETNYFILDSGQHQKDVDFESYEWKRSINNKLSAGDLFIYRKPKSMTGRNEFMFFGMGRIGQITGADHVVAKIEKPHPFPNPVFQHEIEKYQWTWKERGGTWEHFWNQYGINKIPKEDFLYLLQLVEGDYDPEVDSASVEQDIEIAEEDFSVPDSKVLAPSRPWQAAWSKRVKEAYGYQCAVCEMSLPPFLIGSHIIPVSDKIYEYIRKNPANGICLCTIHDKAFDIGYLTITEDLTIKISEKAKADKMLLSFLEPHNGNKIKKPSKYLPKPEYLRYHYTNIFLK